MLLQLLAPLVLGTFALGAKRNFPHHEILRRADANGSSDKPGFFEGVTDNPALDVGAGVNVDISADLNLDSRGFDYGTDKIRGVNLGGVSGYREYSEGSLWYHSG